MARVIRLGDIGDYANTQMEKLLKSAVLILTHCLNQLAQLTPADFALAGRLVRMLLAPTMLGHSNRPLAHTRIKPNRQASQHHLRYAG
jgi:hypothetical protein